MDIDELAYNWLKGVAVVTLTIFAVCFSLILITATLDYLTYHPEAEKQLLCEQYTVSVQSNANAT